VHPALETRIYVSVHAKLAMHIFQYYVEFMYNPWYIKPLFASAARLPVLPQPPSFSIIAAVNKPLSSLLMITPVPR
jgi:hypothetical protein